MQALTTAFAAPSWCLDRFAVYIDNNPYHSSTLAPSRGWIDPSFSNCVPSQYTGSLQVFSPGVCPDYMTIARTTSTVDGSKTTWTGGCCQSGFSATGEYYCTSTVTTPMAFLLAANISSLDIYTTLSDLSIEHDQMTVAWQETDMEVLPTDITSQYGSIMGPSVAITGAESSTTAQITQATTGRITSTIVTATLTTEPTTSTTEPTTSTVGSTTAARNTTSAHTSSSSPMSSGSRLLWRAVIALAVWPVLLRGVY
ncbi:hypothetical protein F4818DRAFT_180573 [Hypoxylon cercidicola]|nr:hypothetical protein F4818DRAFT_180573 [Hypoxylon cercidicola]